MSFHSSTSYATAAEGAEGADYRLLNDTQLANHLLTAAITNKRMRTNQEGDDDPRLYRSRSEAFDELRERYTGRGALVDKSQVRRNTATTAQRPNMNAQPLTLQDRLDEVESRATTGKNVFTVPIETVSTRDPIRMHVDYHYQSQRNNDVGMDTYGVGSRVVSESTIVEPVRTSTTRRQPGAMSGTEDGMRGNRPMVNTFVEGTRTSIPRPDAMQGNDFGTVHVKPAVLNTDIGEMVRPDRPDVRPQQVRQTQSVVGQLRNDTYVPQNTSVQIQQESLTTAANQVVRTTVFSDYTSSRQSAVIDIQSDPIINVRVQRSTGADPGAMTRADAGRLNVLVEPALPAYRGITASTEGTARYDSQRQGITPTSQSIYNTLPVVGVNSDSAVYESRNNARDSFTLERVNTQSVAASTGFNTENPLTNYRQKPEFVGESAVPITQSVAASTGAALQSQFQSNRTTTQISTERYGAPSMRGASMPYEGESNRSGRSGGFDTEAHLRSGGAVNPAIRRPTLMFSEVDTSQRR
jgi:hypothetical protein